MPEIKIDIEHHIGREEAIKRLENFTIEAKTVYSSQLSNVNIEWNGARSNFSFTYAKMAIKGSINVDNSTVAIHGKIPFALFLFKDKIISEITKHGKQMLVK